MKLEMGESLMQSFLKHVKGCIITQTNWKSAHSWNTTTESWAQATALFETNIRNHQAFSDIFKDLSLKQTLDQAEIDVIGIIDDTVYMAEVAFHEKGLQYGKKEEINERVFKKLLRAYLIGLAYFPDSKYEIIFASPKVNPAPDTEIRKTFEVLQKDFNKDEKVSFHYIVNDDFKDKILVRTLQAAASDADTSALFLHSVKLLNLFGMVSVVPEHEQIKAATDANDSDGYSLQRYLQSVGYKTFIEYFEQYVNPQCTTNDIRELLMQSGKYTLNSCNTKASIGKTIVNKKLVKEALEIIAHAEKADPAIVKKAQELLKNYTA